MSRIAEMLLRKRTAPRRAAIARGCIFLLALATLHGCGGGGGLAGDDNQSPDPTVVEYPIAYVQRPTPDPAATTDEQSDLLDPFAFHAGAKLLVRSRADSSAPEINITDRLFPGKENLYDVKDLAVSPDGKKLVFALHAPENPTNPPSWDIWIYDFASTELRPVISSKSRSDGSDVAPQFLEDGRIVFVSDRQANSQKQLRDAPGIGYSGVVEPNGDIKAGVLHVMDADGTDIDQISYNQSHDLAPSQLRNGKLVFARWDNMNGTANNIRMNLYRVNPSGMGLSLVYGYHSHNTGTDPAENVQFSQPREMEDGRLVTILRQNLAASMGGDLVAIDINHFSDNTQPLWNTSTTGSAQRSLAANPVHTDNTLSPGGEFSAVWPLFDGTGRMLISWSQCRYMDGSTIRPCLASTPGTAPKAPLLYGIWVFDPSALTQKPIVTPREGVIYTDIVAASPVKNIVRATDPTLGASVDDIPDYGLDAITALSDNGTAVLDIRSVYNLDNTVGNFGAAVPANMLANQVDPANAAYQNRRARFLQIIQAVPLPDPDDRIPAGNNKILRVNNAFLNGAGAMRHIVGYVPIEADGSVVVQVPPDVPLTFNILDANAQKINATAHPVWWQFRKGEVVRCVGCHDTTNATRRVMPHGRLDNAAPDANPGVTAAGFFAGVSASVVNFPGIRAGQSMAQVYATNKQKPRLPSLNVYFEDEWAFAPGQRNPTLDYRYLANAVPQQQVPVPPVNNAVCLENPTTPLTGRWNVDCRIIINYLDHIQPIWDRSHPYQDSNNVAVSTPCTSCHVQPHIVGGVNEPAAGQLELTSGPSNRSTRFVMSFSELFTGDNKKDAAGVDILVPVLDDNGNPTFDGLGNPILQTQPIGHVMNAGSARNSARFFGCFNGGTCGFSGTTTVDHSTMLTKAELRLISEWLDIGAQYYNDVVKAAAAQ